MEDHVTVALASLGAASTGALIGLMPKVNAVREATPGSDVAHDMHTALVIGSGVVFGFAGIAAIATKSAAPMFIAALGVFIVYLGYNWALTTDGLVLC